MLLFGATNLASSWTITDEEDEKLHPKPRPKHPVESMFGVSLKEP